MAKKLVAPVTAPAPLPAPSVETPGEKRNEENIDRMSLQLPKGLGEKIRKIVERRGIGLSTFIREAIEDAIERDVSLPEEEGGNTRRHLVVWVSRDYAQALGKAAELLSCDEQSLVQRILRENVGHYLSQGFTDRDALKNLLKQDGHPAAASAAAGKK